MFNASVTRVPLIIVWPEQIAPGQRFSQPVSMIDVLPTILSLAGLPMPEILQGQSLTRLLLEEEGWEPRPVVLDEFAVDVAPVPRDAVERIASQLIEGTLTKKEAIEQLLAQTMGTQTVQALPDDIQAEIMDVLQAMLETDPHLKSLVAALGPDEDG